MKAIDKISVLYKLIFVLSFWLADSRMKNLMTSITLRMMNPRGEPAASRSPGKKMGKPIRKKTSSTYVLPIRFLSIVDDGYKCEKEECGFQKTCLPWRGCQSKACEEDLTCQYLYGSGCVCKDGKCHYACKEDSGCSWGFKCHNQTCVKQDGGGGGVSPTMLEPPMEEPTMKQQM